MTVLIPPAKPAASKKLKPLKVVESQHCYQNVLVEPVVWHSPCDVENILGLPKKRWNPLIRYECGGYGAKDDVEHNTSSWRQQYYKVK